MGKKACPLAGRIKKLMQADEDVGKISQATPVLLARAMELFLQGLCEQAGAVAHARQVKTVTPSHLKHCVGCHDTLDFLKELVASAPDLPPEDQAPKRRRTAAAIEGGAGEGGSDGVGKRGKRARPVVPAPGLTGESVTPKAQQQGGRKASTRTGPASGGLAEAGRSKRAPPRRRKKDSDSEVETEDDDEDEEEGEDDADDAAVVRLDDDDSDSDFVAAKRPKRKPSGSSRSTPSRPAKAAAPEVQIVDAQPSVVAVSASQASVDPVAQQAQVSLQPPPPAPAPVPRRETTLGSSLRGTHPLALRRPSGASAAKSAAAGAHASPPHAASQQAAPPLAAVPRPPQEQPSEDAAAAAATAAVSAPPLPALPALAHMHAAAGPDADDDYDDL